MVKKDEYNYQELRRKIGMMEGRFESLEKENGLLKMMCVSLNRDINVIKNTINPPAEIDEKDDDPAPQQKQPRKQRQSNQPSKQHSQLRKGLQTPRGLQVPQQQNEIEINIARR